MTTPRLLDLFCGAGGAAMGYSRAGWQVHGVDHRPQPRYPFAFVLGDALEYVAAHGREYDAIHASPPCQWGTAYARRPGHVRPSPNLIAETRDAIRGALHVLEQPEHGRPFMRDPECYCGSAFGLDVRRHRLFESNAGLLAPPCDHEWQAPRFAQATNRANQRRTVEVGVWRIPLDVQRAAMGIDWMNRAELSQAIPPAYTEHIGRQLLALLVGGGCADDDRHRERHNGTAVLATSIVVPEDDPHECRSPGSNGTDSPVERGGLAGDAAENPLCRAAGARTATESAYAPVAWLPGGSHYVGSGA